MGDVWIKGSKTHCTPCNLQIHASNKRNHESSALHKKNVARVLKNALRKSGVVRDVASAPNRNTLKIDSSLYGLGNPQEHDHDWKNNPLNGRDGPVSWHPNNPIWDKPAHFPTLATTEIHETTGLGVWEIVHQEQNEVQHVETPLNNDSHHFTQHEGLLEKVFESHEIPKTNEIEDVDDDDHCGDNLTAFEIIEKIAARDAAASNGLGEVDLVFKKRTVKGGNSFRKKP